MHASYIFAQMSLTIKCAFKQCVNDVFKLHNKLVLKTANIALYQIVQSIVYSVKTQKCYQKNYQNVIRKNCVLVLTNYRL